MSNPVMSSAGLPPERKKLLFRAWHRGMRETDILMGKFAEARLAGMSEAEIADFERLIDAPDPDILSWATGQSVVPVEFDTPVWRALVEFHNHKTPLKF